MPDLIRRSTPSTPTSRRRSLERMCMAAIVGGVLAGVLDTIAIGEARTPDLIPAHHPEAGPLAEAVSLARRGQRDQAEQICRSLLLQRPQDEQAYRTLMWLTRDRSLPAASLAFEQAQQRLGDGFDLVQTERCILLSDAETDLTRQHARWVERTVEEFNRFVERSGLRPLPLKHKLVCVLFEDYAEYEAFARSHDGVVNPAFTGYYSPRNDRVVFSLQPRALLHSESGSAPLTPAKAAPCGDPHHQGAAGHAGSGDSAAKCVHETIHQLMFHTRIMSPQTQYPLWICEGLSTAFETDAPDAPFGPDRDYAPRREGFERLLARRELMPLAELVTLAQAPADKPHVLRAVYHQSYALVTWICRERQGELRAYLASMLDEPAGRLTASRHLELFEQAFGDAEHVEREWLSHERTSAPRSIAAR